MLERYLRWVQKNEETFWHGTWEERIRLMAFIFIVCLLATPVVVVLLGALVLLAFAV